MCYYGPFYPVFISRLRGNYIDTRINKTIVWHSLTFDIKTSRFRPISNNTRRNEKSRTCAESGAPSLRSHQNTRFPVDRSYHTLSHGIRLQTLLRVPEVQDTTPIPLARAWERCRSLPRLPRSEESSRRRIAPPNTRRGRASAHLPAGRDQNRAMAPQWRRYTQHHA